MPIHLKEDLLVELNLMHKYGINTVLTFSKYTSPFLHRGNPTENFVFMWISGNTTVCLPMTIPLTIMQLAACQTQHNTWRGSLYSASSIAFRLITDLIWRINGQ